MNNKFWKLFIVVLFVLVLLSSGVLALGVTPARTTIDFSPGLERTVDILILNTDKESANLVIYAQGELNQSISFKETSIVFKDGEESKQISYNIKLPQNLESGLHSAEVVILQIPEKSATSSAYIGARVGVVTQVYVYVPYPERYVEADLNVFDAEQGGEANFVIPVINRGNSDSKKVVADIDIYNKSGDKVATFKTSEVYLKSGERKEIVARWKADVIAGVYKAVATLNYDGNIIILEREFSLGSVTLDLQQISVKDFTLGGIAKIDMFVQNKWTDSVQGVYTETDVFNAKGQPIAYFKSPTYDIEPLGRSVFTSYWDTQGVEPGDYSALLYLRYGEKASKKEMQLKVSQGSLEFIGVGYAISNGESSGGKGSMNTILVMVIVVLILVNLAWFLMFRKLIKKRAR